MQDLYPFIELFRSRNFREFDFSETPACHLDRAKAVRFWESTLARTAGMSNRRGASPVVNTTHNNIVDPQLSKKGKQLSSCKLNVGV